MARNQSESFETQRQMRERLQLYAEAVELLVQLVKEQAADLIGRRNRTQYQPQSIRLTSSHTWVDLDVAVDPKIIQVLDMLPDDR